MVFLKNNVLTQKIQLIVDLIIIIEIILCIDFAWSLIISLLSVIIIIIIIIIIKLISYELN